MNARARIVTIAWGDSYIDTLRSLTLTSLLAPGNLPSLTRMLDCELVIVTEQRFFVVCGDDEGKYRGQNRGACVRMGLSVPEASGSLLPQHLEQHRNRNRTNFRLENTRIQLGNIQQGSEQILQRRK